MEKVTFGGKTYVKASVIAQNLGYTTDYVGQLCRSEKADCQLVGRSWFVEADSIKVHKSNRYRSTKAATKKTIKKQLGDSTETKIHFDSYKTPKSPISIRYNADDSELYPSTKKQPPESSPVNREEFSSEHAVELKRLTEDGDSNPQKKVGLQLSGVLKITEHNSDDLVTSSADFSTSSKDIRSQRSVQGNRLIVKNATEKPLKSAATKPKDAHTQSDRTTLNTKSRIKKSRAVANASTKDVTVSKHSHKLSISLVVSFAVFFAVSTVGLEARVAADSSQSAVHYAFALKESFLYIYTYITAALAGLL